MKKILFFSTNRCHLARQKFLLEELKKYFEVMIEEIEEPEYIEMTNHVEQYVKIFNSVLQEKNPDIVLARGDRYEVLPMVMLAVYRGIPVVHLEGGDLSGAIDNKVRHAITQLADVHFATNKESYARLISMGTDPDKTFNFGSLDAEYASQVPLTNVPDEPYVVVAFHPIPGEDGSAVKEAVHNFFKEKKIIEIHSNKDYGMVYPGEEYEADDYISLLAYADCLIGNSSSFIKEASVFSTPVVLVGSRQQNRLLPPGIVRCEHEVSSIHFAIQQALQGRRGPSITYLKPQTSVNIAKTINRLFL